jgi:hypothetical protein
MDASFTLTLFTTVAKEMLPEQDREGPLRPISLPTKPGCLWTPLIWIIIAFSA